MSNYPRPPTFGTPFNPNVHMEPPVGSYDNGLPQYPYPYQNASSLYGQGQMNGMPIVPHTNANTHSFHSNAQGVTTPSSGNEIYGAPYPSHGGQIQYSAFQSPAFPPTPSAHGVPSYEAQNFTQPSTSSNLPSNPGTVFSNLQAAAEVQSTNIRDSDTVPPALSELEDGELDDGEIEKSTRHSRASTAAFSGMAQHKRHEDEDPADRESGHRVANAPNKPLPGLIRDSLAAPNSPGSTASQPRPYPMRNGFINHLDDPLFSRTAENTSAQPQLSMDTVAQGSKEASLRLVDQKMDEAKQALRDLHSEGFDFNRIVNAGLNPDILRKLYTNIGLPVTASSNLLQQKIVKPRVGARDVPTESTPGEAIVGIHDQHPKPPQRGSNDSVLGYDTFPHLVNEEGKINSQPTVAANKNEEKSVQSQASSAKLSKSSSLNPLGKATGIKAGETKILDRKEYIARMLAAKAGKPTVSATTPVSPKLSTITDSGTSAQVQSSDAASAIIPATAQQAPSESVDTAQGIQNEDSDVEAKRKAQTDLARQKIEALKLRESIQQQARSTTSSDAMRHSQQPPAKGVPNIPAESSIPTSRPVPSRQSSYFSPASQKPPFSIPGLFMTSDAPEPVNPSQPLANEGFAVSPQTVGLATFAASKQRFRPHAAVSAQSPTTDETPRLPKTSFDLNFALPATIATTVSPNRKRQKASDFIDSPSTRVKRPLGQQEDTSVIIDISDDEVSNNTSGDESLDTDIAGRRDSLSRNSQVIAPGNGNERLVKSLPPLTDFPPRKKTVIMTPPAAQVSGQSGDLKGLKSKEMEIEVMNRKIAELEQRIAIKAKQTTSRTHSPGNCSRVTTSPPPGEAPHQSNGTPNTPSSISDSRNGDIAPVKNGESFATLAEGNDSTAEEQLNAEQQLEEVELAKAEAERSLAAEISRASAADQSLTQIERMQIPQAEEQSNLRGEEQRLKDEKQKRLQDEEQRRLEESQSQQAREQDNKNLRQQEVDHHLQEQEQRRAQEARQKHLQERERKTSLGNQRQARKTEIESGLPLLDAEVERTRIRLESLRQEIVGLETELQKGIEGRQVLIEELNNLSRSGEALPRPMDLDSCDVGDIPNQSTSIQEIPALTKPAASVETVPDLDSIQLSGTAGAGNGRVVQDKSSTRTADIRMSDGELEEDIMEMSRSDVDEAEPSFHSPKPLTEVQDTSGSIDDDETYEPPSEISITQRQEPEPDAVPDLGTAKTDRPAAMHNPLPADQEAEPIEKPSSVEPSPAANAGMAGDEQSQRSLNRSQSLADASDPDDYEPPEPAPLGEEVPRPTEISSVDSEKSFSPPDVDSHDFIAPASFDSTPAVHQQVSVDAITIGAGSHSVQKLESNGKTGHFTPYESPLKQFKSFRYHPQYLEEVSNGFRSLTYSHTINPEIPLCRYELDGVCNDDSCPSQHLRSIGLSDDKILVDLGAKPDDGSSPDEFGNGLREVIHDIRSRKIRDFNIVAGEITAYRAKFLGDRSKVLPL